MVLHHVLSKSLTTFNMHKKSFSFLACLFFGLISVSLVLSQASQAQSPLNDALAVWHMDGTADASGNGNVLQMFGKPEIVDLTADEAAESRLRGGDGKAMKFAPGDYLSAGQGKNSMLNLTGRKMSVYVRLRVPTGNWDFPILAKHGGHERLAYNLYASRDRLGSEVGTTGNRRFLSATVPFTDLLSRGEGASVWHDVIFRVDGAKLELFVDGRCVDEDFMIGDLRQNDEPLLIGAESYGGNVKTGFNGLIDHIAIWNRTLTNEEIITLSGGQKKADLRERTDRDIPGESLQYWRPPNNYYVGDCLPFYHNGVFHFAYLLDKEHHQAKNGVGAHQWIQATSTDLKNWTHQPFILAVTEQWEGSICTGSVFYHDGLFYAFYATRAMPGIPTTDGRTFQGEYVAYATSTDGINFTKQEPNPLIILPADAGYSRAGRDPVVFQDERDGLFHMYITSNYRGNGCWAHLTSKDLKNWELQLPVLAGGGDPECPDWFQWGDTYYLIINWGNGFYRTSKSPTGPWEKPDAPDILMPGAPRVPKTAAYHNGRRIICGWTNENGFGGHAIFHELIRNEDGTLGEKFVPEMIPKTGEPMITLTNVSDQERTFANLPEHYRLQMVVTFDKNDIDSLGEWRMIYHRDASNRDAVRFVPSEKALYLGRTKLEQVNFTAGRISLDLIVKNRIVDLCIDNRRTVTGIVPNFPVRDLSINNRPQQYQVESLIISPLVD